MANPIKGEVPLEINGRAYTFVLGTYGLAALERRVGMPWIRIFERGGKGEWGIADVLAVVHAGLLKHHRTLTEEQVADLIDAAGLPAITKTINDAFEVAISVGAYSGGSEPANPTPTNGSGMSTSLVG